MRELLVRSFVGCPRVPESYKAPSATRSLRICKLCHYHRGIKGEGEEKRVLCGFPYPLTIRGRHRKKVKKGW